MTRFPAMLRRLVQGPCLENPRKMPEVLPLRVSPPRAELKNQEPESDGPRPSPSSDNSRQCDLGQSFSALSSTSENVG